MNKTILFPHPPGSCGPGSFQSRFEQEIQKHGWKVSYARDNISGDVILIVGGTAKLFWLLKMKLKHIPIIHRIDGINWLHRKKASKKNLISFLVHEKNNIIIKIINAFLADYIIYQSDFVRNWWLEKGWRKRKDHYSIIYNAVDLTIFRPPLESNSDPKLICLEGTVDYTPYAVDLINEINEKIPIKMEVYGGIQSKRAYKKLSKNVDYKGKIDKSSLPNIYANNIYLSLDINAACPNTVIEALSCGSPIVAFDTGSLKELVSERSGILVPYGSNPWKLGYPDVKTLIKAILKIKQNFAFYSENARKSAEEKYSIDDMIIKYLDIINSVVK